MVRHLTILVLAAAAAVVAQPLQRRPATLIVTNAIVVTMDPANRVLMPGAVAIADRDIVAVDTPEVIAQQFEAKDTIDAAGQVVMPGLINTHTHAAMVLYRGLADDLALMEWLQKYIFPAEAKTVSPEFVRAGTRLAALEMIQSGTTTFTDMYYFEEEVARAAREAGLRGVLGQTIIQFPVADAATPAAALVRGEAFIKAFAGDDLITPALAPHSMYTLDRATLTAVRSLADRAQAPVLIHLAETRDEIKTARERYRMTPTAWLEAIRFWGARSVAAHGVWLTPADIRILARRGVGVSHNPESNMKLASGTAPVPAMGAAGVKVGLGTDGAASNNDLDMFEAMRQAALLHKLTTGDPRAVPAAAALRMATIDGAGVLGMETSIGSLEVGKRADLIAVSMRAARQTPMYDPLSHLVYVTRGDDVQTTIVNGRVLMRERRVLSLDADAVIAEGRSWTDKVRQAVGAVERK